MYYFFISHPSDDGDDDGGDGDDEGVEAHDKSGDAPQRAHVVYGVLDRMGNRCYRIDYFRPYYRRIRNYLRHKRH